MKYYEILNLVWKILIDLSPTAIAIATIIATARIEKKRAKEQFLETEIKELQNRVACLMSKILEINIKITEMEGYLSDKEEVLNNIEELIKQLKYEAAFILSYADIRVNVLGCNAMNFEDVNRKVIEYCNAVEKKVKFLKGDNACKETGKEWKRKAAELRAAILCYGMENPRRTQRYNELLEDVIMTEHVVQKL